MTKPLRTLSFETERYFHMLPNSILIATTQSNVFIDSTH